MKRIIALFMPLLLAASLIVTVYANDYADFPAITETEPNDTTDTAQTLLTTSCYIVGKISSDDNDVFRIPIEQTSNVEILLFEDKGGIRDVIDVSIVHYYGETIYHAPHSVLNDQDGNFMSNVYNAALSANKDFYIVVSLKPDVDSQAYEYMASIKIVPFGNANFKKVNDYAAHPFSDVPSTAWFAENVKTAYELGLVNGNDGLYNPSGNLTYAETLALACRMHSIYSGKDGNFAQGNPWYQVYVDYAEEHSLFSSDDESIYTKPITRAAFAGIMANAMGNSLLTINDMTVTPPDIYSSTQYRSEILSLYAAGILSGSDEYGSFHPNNKIQRSEVATIVTRLALPETRIHFTLKKKPVEVMTIMIHGNTQDLFVGESTQLSAIFYPEEAAEFTTFTWKSSDNSIATVSSNGLVKAKKAGAVTITVTASNQESATYNITVYSQDVHDIVLAKLTYKALYSTVKFPDTLKVHNIWAYDTDTGERGIEIDYSANNNYNISVRQFFRVYYRDNEIVYYKADTTPIHTKNAKVISTDVLK